MHSSTKTLSSYINVHDDALGLPGETGISISHGERNHFIGAGDDTGELVTAFILAFDDGLYNARMVGPEVDKAVGDTCLYEGYQSVKLLHSTET